MKKKKKKLTQKEAKKRGLVSGRELTGNVFSGLNTEQRQQIGKTFGRAVRQPNRRGGR